MFGQIKMFALAGLVVAILAGVSFAYVHYRNVLSERDEAIQEATLEKARNAELTEWNRLYQERIKEINRETIRNAEVAHAAQQEVDKLSETIQKLPKALKSRPTLTLRLINRATADHFRMLEETTGTVSRGPGAAPEAGTAPAEAN